VSRERALFDLAKPRAKASPAPELVEQILAAGLPEPELELQFAKTLLGRNWSFDFGWRDPWRIALEIEGAMFGGRVINVGDGAFEYRTIRGQKTHVPVTPHSIVRLGGRHNTGGGLLADLEKYNTAAMLGWVCLRATTTDVRDGRVIPLLRQAFQFRWRYARLVEQVYEPLPLPAPERITTQADTGHVVPRERSRRTAADVPW
jgi:hypothetical protein